MKKILSDKEYKILSDNLQSITYTCKCGHRVAIYHPDKKVICSYCGNYVFKSKKDEFEYRVKERMKK